MIQATLPPKVNDVRLLIVPFLYAGALAVLALLQLVGFGGFDFAGIKLETTGEAWAVITLAGLEIFALPFLLRLNLSPLARACSAVFALAVPLFYLVSAMFLRDQAVAPLTPTELIIGAVLGVMAITSFNVLRGDQALGLPAKK